MGKNPIAEHKERDVTHLREVLLSIVDDGDTTKKDKIEASKLLLRAHHSLQAERITTSTKEEKSPFSKTREAKIDKRIDEILDGFGETTPNSEPLPS